MITFERTVVSDGAGHVEISEVPPGRYQVLVRALGFGSRVVEVEVLRGSWATLEVALERVAIELREFVVTATATERSLEETVRPTTVMSAEDLAERLGVTLAATLKMQPGLAETSMGPATGQPVLRGLSGDRVLVLEDGQRTGDLSSSGPDHAVAVEPLSANRVEIVRGPSALMYGSNALGGVINVIRDDIPTAVPERIRGSLAVQGQSVNRGGVGDVVLRYGTGQFAMRAEGSYRSAGDLRTPLGILESTSLENINAAFGAGYVEDWGNLGAGYRYVQNSYGVPASEEHHHEEGEHHEGVRIDMWRHNAKGQAFLDRGWGVFETIRAQANGSRYQHDETEGESNLETRFILYTGAGDLIGNHGTFGPFSEGAVGVRVHYEDFTTAATQATTPSQMLALSGFLVERIDAGPIRAEVGLRYDWHRVTPLDTTTVIDIGDVRTRTFGALSGSVGVLYRLAGGIDLGASAARAFRTPDYVELYSQGPHAAAHTYEVGNPDLAIEAATGFDTFIRARTSAVQSEIAFFMQWIDDYIYARNTGETGPFDLPIYQFTGEDARLVGGEGSILWMLAPTVTVNANMSYVHATNTTRSEPLPLIPPLMGNFAVRYGPPKWFVEVGAKAAARQDRVSEFEEPTDGYVVPSVSAGYTWRLRRNSHSLTLRADNLTNKVYYNHLNRVKSVMPEAGRNLSLLYRVDF
jgi:iron complex outermembrane receptor protein